jgi:putative ABC transport system permease protein
MEERPPRIREAGSPAPERQHRSFDWERNVSVIPLTPLDLSIAASLVLVLALLSLHLRLRLFRPMVVAAVRTTAQLLLVGIVLKAVFENVHPAWLGLISIVMLGVAAREVGRRQKLRMKGGWGFGVGAASMFLSSFSITALALTVIVQVEPWYRPQYAIPLLGMLLGNTMNGIALGLDRLSQSAWEQREIVESRLILGQTWSQAIDDIRRDSIRSGLIPIVNAMSIAGLVSLPGMMTGQILGGSPPMEAVKYQILIMFLIASGTGFGTIFAVWTSSRRLFDERQRLRIEDRFQRG